MQHATNASNSSYTNRHAHIHMYKYEYVITLGSTVLHDSEGHICMHFSVLSSSAVFCIIIFHFSLIFLGVDFSSLQIAIQLNNAAVVYIDECDRVFGSSVCVSVCVFLPSFAPDDFVYSSSSPSSE